MLPDVHNYQLEILTKGQIFNGFHQKHGRNTYFRNVQGKMGNINGLLILRLEEKKFKNMLEILFEIAEKPPAK